MGTLLKTFGSQSSNRRSSGWGIQQDIRYCRVFRWSQTS
nr:MAG TPA: hypothetical protein [Caudoviricetes sp.]